MMTAAPQNDLKSTTAPGKLFQNRAELAEHYKSDWHKYNLKRREAGLALLDEEEFKKRWEAAFAMRQEKAVEVKRDHLKNKTKIGAIGGSKRTKQHQQQQQQQQSGQRSMKVASVARESTNDSMASNSDGPPTSTKTIETSSGKTIPVALAVSQENPVIDPHQCLFDNRTFDSLQDNVQYMQRQYGFFVPDQECLVDLEGLLGYCHEKIKLGHFCLYCERVFPTWQGCQQHMIHKQHTKLRYEQGYDCDEMDPFYNFGKDDDDDNLHMAGSGRSQGGGTAPMETEVNTSDDNDDESEEISEGDGNEEGDNNESLYDGFEREIARFGLDVTPLGELVFPDGRVVGHRALRRYYKQNLRTNEDKSTAVAAAQQAAGERIYGGQVINIHQYNLKADSVQGAGKGILVPVSKDGTTAGGFSTLSLYRYRAAVRKQRRGDEKGQRLHHKSYYGQNHNKMDKKHNRIMNGVSVAHAAR